MTDRILCHPGEVWKPVVYPGLVEPLEASSLGRVRRAERSYWVCRNDVMAFVATRRQRIAKPILRVGYPSVSCKLENGKRPFIAVHILVCYAFRGPPPSDKHQVGHRDGDPLNAEERNLRWVTPLENAADREVHGRTAKGEKIATSLLTERDVIAIREACAGAERGIYTRLARLYGVSRSTIARAANSKTWRHM